MSANKKIVNTVLLLTCTEEGQQHSAHLFEILGCNDSSTSLCDQWHLRRDAATIQRNTCELRYLKQHNIKNLFIKLTWTLRTCHFRRRYSTKTNREWLTLSPWQQHVLQYTGQLRDFVPLIAEYDGLARRFFALQFFGFWFSIFRFFVLQFFFSFFILLFLFLWFF